MLSLSRELEYSITLMRLLELHYLIYILQATFVWTLVGSFDVSTPTSITAAKKFAVFYDSSNHLHRDRTFHYENPERITVCIEALHNYAWNEDKKNIDLIDIAPTMYDSLTPKSFQSMTHRAHHPVTSEELQYARSILLQTHQSELITVLEDRCAKSKAQRIMDGKSSLGYIGYLDGGDTYVTTETLDVCLRATVAWIRAVDYCYSALGKDTDDNYQYFAMACTRPPGHHATYDLQNGFCLYNFAAATAIHALSIKNTRNNTMMSAISKVSILDWDVHYGQGVADIVTILPNYRNSIRYVSIHQTPAFPYEGERRQQKENVMTLPIPPDTSWTCGYSEIFEEALQFCIKANEWEPDLIIICAGYDALSNDELASVNLDAVDYGCMVQRLCHHISTEITTKTKPKIMLGLEGGYKINSSGGGSGNLPDAIVETVKAFMSQPFI
jgi:acetoin utilization deacetylase AcuC-like enzyme